MWQRVFVVVFWTLQSLYLLVSLPYLPWNSMPRTWVYTQCTSLSLYLVIPSPTALQINTSKFYTRNTTPSSFFVAMYILAAEITCAPGAILNLGWSLVPNNFYYNKNEDWTVKPLQHLEAAGRHTLECVPTETMAFGYQAAYFAQYRIPISTRSIRKKNLPKCLIIKTLQLLDWFVQCRRNLIELLIQLYRRQ